MPFTIVRILTTLLPPDSGSARVAGFDVVHDAAALRSVIGLAGQFAAVDENLTGRENLELVGRLYHLRGAEARRRADEMLERFELTDAAARTVKTYSGGMRRRLDLGRALSVAHWCCSWTSPPPGWTHAAATPSGTSSGSWSTTAPPCCSPPSTWRRPTAWPTASR